MIALVAVTAAGATAGDLDTSFGSGGKTVTNLGLGTEQTSSVAVQPNGAIVVAGTSALLAGGISDFAVLRYNRDGSPDPTFGSGGTVRTDMGSSTLDFAAAVVLQPNGKIVVGGTTVGASNDFALARYDPDGSLDQSFGSGGKVITDVASASIDAVQSLAVQPDGRIITGGVGIVSGNNDFTLARYHADGSLDASFGSGGIVRVDLGSTSDNLHRVALLPNGKIVAVGNSNVQGTFDFAVMRLEADGTLDQSFGTGGMVFTDISGTGDFAAGADIQPNGKLVVAGWANCCLSGDFEVVRYNHDGSLDTSFGSDGIVVTDHGSGNETVRDLAIMPSGKIVVAGRSAASGTADIAVLRYNSDGSVDCSFGSGGIVLTDFASSFDYAGGVALEPDGGIVGAGGSTPSGSSDHAVVVVRYLAR